MTALSAVASWRAVASLGRMRRRFWRNNRGAAAVEFGLIALPFFGLVAAMLETGILMFADSALDTATSKAARLIRTGQAQQQNFDQTAFRNQVCAAGPVFFDCSKVKVDVTTAASFAAMSLAPPLKDDGSLDEAKLGYNAGRGGDIVVVRVYYDWPIVLNRLATLGAGQNGQTKRLTAVAAFRNEPFNW